MGNESQLVEMLPSSEAGQRVFASSLETVDGRAPSRRIVLEDEVEPALRDQDRQTELEARDAARDVAIANYPLTIGPGSEAARDRSPATLGSPGGELRARPLGYPLKAGAGPWLDGGSGASPSMMYPTGVGTLLGPTNNNPPLLPPQPARLTKRDRTRFAGYEAAGFNSNTRLAAHGAMGMDALTLGSDWEVLSDFVHDRFMPNAGTATLIPCDSVVSLKFHVSGEPFFIETESAPRQAKCRQHSSATKFIMCCTTH